ncbi:hypothetical protein PV396_43930 [Streptomyces sp. ME02-8801-2C]|uniref:hypothetical protein n=1 Tax=Streptomyces sp. ME02-8801-2C TaxID=3028680 RepID=UPI0029AE7085|nr:hypothetical protein [Streptomyces sp. ME02-8801-2C]MDX3458795.1 hypothetical protein [Streptomyces sp. ME02-8801-2C]
MTLTNSLAKTANAPVTTDNGTVTFIDDMYEVALQANRDTYGYYQYLSEIQNAQMQARKGDGLEIFLGALNAGAAFQANFIAAANLGNNIANTVLHGQSSSGELQVSITCNASKPLTLCNYTATGGPDISNVPNPLFAGQSDIVTITDDDEFEEGATLELDFCIGTGAVIDTTHNSMINFSLTYTYGKDEADNERWWLTAAVDTTTAHPNGATHPFPKALQMFGFTFAPNTGYPGFSLYTSPIETANGSISIVTYDR